MLRFARTIYKSVFEGSYQWSKQSTSIRSGNLFKRPYKSLNPYIQFVGRVIRRNGSTDRAYIVSHAGLNQVSRFKEFRLFDQDEQAFLQTRLFSELVPGENKGNDGEMFVKESGAGNDFLDARLQELGVSLLETQHNFVNQEKVGSLVERIKGLTQEEKDLLASLLVEQDPDLVGTFQKTSPHPTVKRKASRSHLHERAKSVTMDVARALGIRQPMKTRTFNPMFNDYKMDYTAGEQENKGAHHSSWCARAKGR